MYNVPNNHVVQDTNKAFHDVDIVSIKDSKIPETKMNKNSGNKRSIYSNTGISNTTHLCRRGLNLKMNDCKDKSKNVDDAIEEYHKDRSNNSDNNKRGIDKGKDKVFNNNNNILKSVIAKSKTKVKLQLTITMS